jgi:hypothetical protein
MTTGKEKSDLMILLKEGMVGDYKNCIDAPHRPIKIE